jgi:hypothetical protein
MAEVMIDTSHDCGDGAAPTTGIVAIHTRASSSCCDAILAEGGTDETGYTCAQCAKPCSKVMGSPTAHWTCTCGTRRSQVITQPVDEPAES